MEWIDVKDKFPPIGATVKVKCNYKNTTIEVEATYNGIVFEFATGAFPMIVDEWRFRT